MLLIVSIQNQMAVSLFKPLSMFCLPLCVFLNLEAEMMYAFGAAPQPNKEWKPKSSQKLSHISPGVIGTPAKSVSPRADNPRDLESETTKLQEKLSQASISENQNVIIAQHIRVLETDRCRLTFGSFGADFTSGFQAVGNSEEPSAEPSARLILPLFV